MIISFLKKYYITQLGFDFTITTVFNLNQTNAEIYQPVPFAATLQEPTIT